MAMMLGLTLLPISTQTVFAANDAGSGGSGGSGMPVISAGDAGHSTTRDIVGGPSKEKVCVFVTVSIADSETSPSTAVGHGIYIINSDYYGNPGDCSSDSKISGANLGGVFSAPWPNSMHWCVGGQNGAGGGKAITNWCANTNTSTGSTWASKRTKSEHIWHRGNAFSSISRGVFGVKISRV